MKTARQGDFLLKQATILLLLALMVTLLAACGGATEKVAKSGTMNAVGEAALTPLNDLNLRREDIPEELQALVDNPYSTPKPLKCKTLKQEIAKLDTLLGKDMDAPKVALSENEQYAAAGAELVQDGIVNFVRSQTTGFIPFRGILRTITGAKAHDKAVAQAKQAGKLRRAYLKGLASAKFGDGCKLGPISVIAENKKKPESDSADLEVAAK